MCASFRSSSRSTNTHSVSYSEKFVRKMRATRKRPVRGTNRPTPGDASATDSVIVSPARTSSREASSAPIATPGEDARRRRA